MWRRGGTPRIIPGGRPSGSDGVVKVRAGRERAGSRLTFDAGRDARLVREKGLVQWLVE